MSVGIYRDDVTWDRDTGSNQRCPFCGLFRARVMGGWRCTRWTYWFWAGWEHL